MTLNYSSRAIFPAASSLPGLPPDGGGFIPSFFREEDYVWEFLSTPLDCASGWRSEKSGGGATQLMKDDGISFDSELPSSPPPSTSPYDDIADLLPADPFGMGLAADTDTWTAAIAGWIEDLAATVVDNVGYYEYGDHHPHVNNFFDYFTFSRSKNSSAMDAATCFSPSCTEDWTCESPLCPSSETENSCGGADSSCSSVPHDALLLSLSYLDIPDLLSVERVCKTMCTAVRGDPLLWRHIHVSPPLSKNITDDSLIRLTEKAKGSLECLSLAECSQITNSGLRYVLENNPKLRKLNIPACMRLNIDNVLETLKQFKSSITNLGVGGLYGINHEHLEVLNGLLIPNQVLQQHVTRKPIFYHLRRITSCHVMAAIDVEECPKCRHVRVVYDCPVSNCRAQATGPCRACSICIVRCDQCGKCINDHDYEETFALDCVCLSCMNCTQTVQQPRELCTKIAT